MADRARKVAAMLAAGSLLLAGCTAPTAESTASTTSSTGTSVATVPALTVTSTPVWGSQQIPLTTVLAADFDGDTAVLVGRVNEGRDKTPTIAAVEAGTGRVRWSYADTQALAGDKGARYDRGVSDAAPTIIRPAGVPGGLVVVRYYVLSCTQRLRRCPAGDRTEEEGVAGLSLADGQVLWKTPILPSVAPKSEQGRQQKGQTIEFRGATATGVLVAAGDAWAINNDRSSAADKLRTVLLDPATGGGRWEKAATRAIKLVDDLVLAATSTDGQLLDGIGGLDGATGSRRWTVPARYPRNLVLAAAGGNALILQYTAKFVPVMQQIRTTDGSLVGTPESLMNCVDDGTTMIACEGGFDDRVTTYVGPAAPVRSVNVAPKGRSFLSLTANGYLFLEDLTSTRAFDRNAAPRSVVLPGKAIAFEDGYLLVRSDTSWSVHRVST